MPPTSIDSNASSLAIAEEASLETLPETPVWYALEPNSYPDFGPSYTTVTRAPIASHRQQLKGSIADLDVKAGWNQDITQHNFTRMLQAFLMMNAIEKPCTNPLNSVAVAISAVTATQYQAVAGFTFLANHLVFAKNFTNTANNGMSKLTAATGTQLTSSKALAVEAAPPAAASLEAVGYEFPAGDLTLTLVGNLVRLGTTATDCTTLGLNVGEWIWIGGDLAANQFATAADKGYGRIAAIGTRAIDLDITSFVAAGDTGVGKNVQVFFGKVFRNATLAEIAANYTVIKKRSFTLERTLGNDGNGTQCEYLSGIVPNEMSLDAKQASKLTADLGFIGCDTYTRTGAQGPLAGTRVASPSEAPYNTSKDIYLIRLAVVDGTLNPTPYFAYGTDLTLTISNDVTAKKGLGNLGAFDANIGTFKVTGKMTAFFSTVAAINAIRSAVNANLQAIMARSNAGMVLDIPLLTLGGGLNKIEKDKPIMVDFNQEGAMNANGYTLLACVFEYLPTVAMPV